MSLRSLLDEIQELPRYRELVGRVPAAGGSLRLGGLPGSSGALAVAALAQAQPQRLFVVVARTPADAEAWLADLDSLSDHQAVLYPQREALGEEEPHYEIAGERVETISAMLEGKARLVVTTLRATAERTRMPGAVSRNRVSLGRGLSLKMADLRVRLERMGYQKAPSVTDVAQYAVRGGIIDVYGFGMSAPARVEWWGDEIESIRSFDLDTQLSESDLETLTMLPVSSVASSDPSGESGGSGEDTVRQSLLDLLPPDTLLCLAEPLEETEVHRIWSEAEHQIELARRRGEDLPGRETILLDPESWRSRWVGFGKLEISDSDAELDMGLLPPPPVNRKMRALSRLISTGRTVILCDNEGQRERLEELLSDERTAMLPSGVSLVVGGLTGGFVLGDLKVMTDHEIFRRARRIRRPRRYRQALTPASESFKSGDFVVHLDHGIGIYRGIDTISVRGAQIEVARVEYEGGDLLNVPLYRLDQLELYRTTDGTVDGPPPRLDRLGSTKWQRQRQKTQENAKRLAAELLELYARRSAVAGFSCPPDSNWQRELESSFLYEDTPDQRAATEDVKRDLQRGTPMDRLVVGDVGYGKTEIAVRAAFKMVVAGRQVAVLVPTTILAEQHGVTFRDRLADFPVRVEVLSRFRTPAEQKEVLRGLREGSVEVVIGTHRLLSRDVEFKELGLLVVDEEHRFGVRHKERLKELKLRVDVLTLTATPIPRTLQMALSGIRDMSLIQTPPLDRSPVVTFVEPWDDGLIEETISRELDRGGQVFFVHNRIETIGTIGERVRRLAPGATVAIAHGKMPERELDVVMRRFGAGEIDVLVSTMIVESGLDVPNANTMVVHRADQFGLAQLYQLRGRVGRGHRRAYCYLLVPDSVSPEAEDRLKLLEHHTELGSGYRLALRDLELRGAGSLLGREQSGYTHRVGFDLYLRWLNEAVRNLKKEDREEPLTVTEVVFDGPAHLPDSFVSDEDAKLDFYRRLARAEQPGEIARLRSELRDRFGPLPEEADRLLVVSELRFLGARLGIETIIVRGDEARLSFAADASPRLARLTVALDEVQFKAEIRRMVPLSIRLVRLGGMAIGAGLVKAMATALGAPPQESRDRAKELI